MSTQKSTSPQFQITVKTIYVPAESRPETNRHFFAYRITIRNEGSVPAQLLSRHWIITDGFGRVEEVKGPGVIGQQPRLQPGQEFQYESACPLPTPYGSMKGSYQMKSDDGVLFDVEIPEFFLISPQSLH